MCKSIYIIILVAVLFSCKEDDTVIIIEDEFSNVYNLPQAPFNYSDIMFPSTFENEVLEVMDNTPDDNPITNDGATLGRVLFYDKSLSLNNTRSCASCHIQEFSFADSSAKSIGFEGGLTRRNSMQLVNTRFYKPNRFFWDHRAKSLEEQVLQPFQDGLEMGMTLDLLIERVSSNYYKPLFQKAFNSEEITSEKISKALAQFVRSIYSFNSKYDRGIEVTGNMFVDFPNLTVQENLGKDIFTGKATIDANGACIFCHVNDRLNFNTTPISFDNQVVFSGTRMDNIGLDENAQNGVDNGLGEITEIESDNGQFKVPSLRNIELTAPYMHDGRFTTLEEVVEHYSTGIKEHPQLSDHLINGDGSPRHLDLTPEESKALVAFLKTLTDDSLATEEKYSNPFVN